ncbi:MAG: hypothetical protein GF418_08930 [Chitinivibrionales bacterium]|nr:hypothetical protein [Chitinivibrionales bacterium]MBD3395737.1 hypothetical protein [Chitinivibrionales bacterium]
MSSAFACPDFVKKDAVSVGDRANVPAGWFVYGIKDEAGIYYSPAAEFDPVMIPNTDGGVPTTIDISDNGEWLVYLNTNTLKVYLIRPDGSGKIEMPTPGCGGDFPRACGIYRNSPHGSEIFYISTYAEIRAQKLDLSGDTPLFLGDRTVAHISNGGVDDRPSFKAYGWLNELSVNGDHIFSQRMDVTGSYVCNIMFLTIPDGGTGTASYADRWDFTDMPSSSIFGCGINMSQDGTMGLFNPGAQGDPSGECVPNRYNGLDHKGFVLVPVMDKNDPSCGIHELIDVHGVSVNWAPPQYRFGAYNEVDHTDWFFTNKEEYIIGVQQGTKAPDKGVWLVDWQKNEWTLLTDSGLDAMSPAMFFDATLSARHWPARPAPAYRARTSAGGIRTYDIRGRMVPSGAVNRALPHSPGVYISKSANGPAKRLVRE